MTYQIAIKNVRLKKDPTGRVHLVRVHKLDAAKRKRLHAQVKREQERWQAAEHYTPIPKENDQ